jgi:hypothetical protein
VNILTSVPGSRVRLRNAVAAVAVLVLVAAPAAVGQGAPQPDDTSLLVRSGSFAGKAYASVVLSSSASIAGLTLYVPQGYALDLTRPAGTELGYALVSAPDTAGGFGGFTEGTLVSDDPARYAGDAAAQSCAPGAHAAVWRSIFSVAGRSLELPMFLDPAGPNDPAGTAFVLRACPIWPSTEVGVAHRAADFLVLSLDDGVTLPTAPGRYAWSAIVTPTGPLSVAPEPSRAFEVRAIVPQPHVLTLRAKHDPKAKTVLLSGRVTSLGSPEAGVPVELASWDDDPKSRPVSFGPVRTNANGEFQVRRRVVRTTQFTASVEDEPGPCSGSSSAPAGCVSETVTVPDPASAVVVVRAKTDPKLAVRSRDRMRAREAALKLKDFPTGWAAVPFPLPFDACPKFEPDLSALTATGEWNSPAFVTDTNGALSSTTVYRTIADARTAFRKEAQLAVARCVAEEARADGDTVHSVGALTFPRVGDETRAFRLVAEIAREGVVYLDFISIRRGRVVVHMFVSSLGVPLDPLEHSLAAAVAARAR